MNIDIERVNEMNHAHHCYDEVHQSVCSAPTHSFMRYDIKKSRMHQHRYLRINVLCMCVLKFVNCFVILMIQVRYTGYRDRPLEERQMRFQNGCREGHTEIVSVIN
jgi:hypothetical protein